MIHGSEKKILGLLNGNSMFYAPKPPFLANLFSGLVIKAPHPLSGVSRNHMEDEVAPSQLRGLWPWSVQEAAY